VTQASLHEAKTQLFRLVERAAGEEIIIAKGGRPLARLVPLARRTAPRERGFLAGRVRIAPDFDVPLPDDLAAGAGHATGRGCSGNPGHGAASPENPRCGTTRRHSEAERW
jgi:prevent-host-death family protein